MLFEMLETGEQNARSAKELARVLHCDQRRISKLIEEERRNGRPICATSDSRTPGYYIAEDRQTMANYCSSLQHRICEIDKTRQICLQTMERLPNSTGGCEQ